MGDFPGESTHTDPSRQNTFYIDIGYGPPLGDLAPLCRNQTLRDKAIEVNFAMIQERIDSTKKETGLNRLLSLVAIILAIARLARARAETPDDVWLDKQLSSARAIQFEPRDYHFEEPHNLRKDATGVAIIEGYGKATRLFVKGSRKGPFLDAVGNDRLIFQNFEIHGDPADPPDAAILFARTLTRDSAGFHRMERVHIRGQWRLEPLVQIGSEMNVYDQCMFSNYRPGGRGVFISDYPDIPLASPFGPYGGGSHIVTEFRNCHFGVYGYTDTEVAIWIGASSGDIRIIGGSLSAKRGPNGKGARAAIVLAGDTRGQPFNVVIDTLEAESPGAIWGIVATGRSSGISISNSLIYARREAIMLAGDHQGWKIENTRLYAGMESGWASGDGKRATIHMVTGRLRRANFTDELNSWLLSINGGVKFYAQPGVEMSAVRVEADQLNEPNQLPDGLKDGETKTGD